MKYTKFLFLIAALTFSNLIYSQFTQVPTLSPNRHHKTLRIDSIPINKPFKFTIGNISNSTNNYVYHFNLPIGIQYPSYGISNMNRLVINTTSGPLYRSNIYNSMQERSWDNPYGVNSFAEGVFNATINTVFDLFKNN